jgi:hypothetical protein
MFINKFQFVLHETTLRRKSCMVIYDLLSSFEDQKCEETDRYVFPILRPVYAIRAVNAYVSGVTDGEPFIYLHVDVYTAH